jgi:FdhE protein
MAIYVETKDPGRAGVLEAVERYKKNFPDCGDAIDLYGAVMAVQQRTLSEIDCADDLSCIDVESSLREGKPLLDPFELRIPLQEFQHVVGEICGVLEEKGAAVLIGCHELSAWEGLNDRGFQETRKRLLRGERLDTETMEGEAQQEDLIEGILWESLVPFYRKCARGLQDGIDHSLWLRGYCPVCGMGPLMGKFRREDGQWLLECRLCHTLWNVQRAKCPFCLDEAGGSLEYLYLEEDSSRRAQYCSRCKRYIKTIDLRSKQGDAVLPLENIVTELLGLDGAAEREGLRPA